MAKIRDEELTHIISEFSRLEMAEDMAMLFVTQDMPYNRIFDKILYVKDEFYIKVAQYIYSYIMSKLEKGQLDKALLIVERLECKEFTYDTKLNGFFNPDVITSRLLEKIAKYLFDYNNLNGLNMLIDNIDINPNIDNKVIFDLLANNTDMCHQYIISNIISNEYLDITEIFRLILIRADDLPVDDIRALLREIFLNRDLFLKFAAHVFSYFVVSVKEFNDKYEVEVECILPADSSEYEVLETLRRIIIDNVYVDAEMDYYTFLENAEATHKHHKNIYLTNLYKTYVNWFKSREREETCISNFIQFGHEEDFLKMNFKMDNARDMALDAINLNYIVDIEGLTGYDLFIKLFNLNRFSLGHYNNTYTVERHLAPIYLSEQFFIDLASSTNFYIFLCFM